MIGHKNYQLFKLITTEDCRMPVLMYLSCILHDNCIQFSFAAFVQQLQDLIISGTDLAVSEILLLRKVSKNVYFFG